MSVPGEPQKPKLNIGALEAVHQCNAALQENRIAQAYAYDDWQRLLQQGLSRQALTGFHARYKYLLMAHNPLQYKALGKLMGSMEHSDATQLGPYYFSQLMTALERCATRGTHTNVLLHLSGYLRRAISAEDKQALRESIEQYRQGVVPLNVPITLLKDYFRRYPNPYVLQQVYLQPYPESLSVRNAI